MTGEGRWAHHPDRAELGEREAAGVRLAVRPGCRPWCRSGHVDDVFCRSEWLRVGQDGRAVMLVQPPDREPYVLTDGLDVEQLTLGEAVRLRDALSSLLAVVAS